MLAAHRILPDLDGKLEVLERPGRLATSEANATQGALGRSRERVLGPQRCRTLRARGLALLERIRAQDVELPVVLLSGELGEDARRRARELGASDVFAKSADMSQVVERVLERSMQVAEERRLLVALSAPTGASESREQEQ